MTFLQSGGTPATRPGEELLENCLSEKDLGEMTDGQLCAVVAKKDKDILACIRTTADSNSRDVTVPLYSALVRLHLKHCLHFWKPHDKTDIEMLEHVQRRAAKMVKGLQDNSYKEWLRESELFSLLRKRLR